MSLDNLLRTSVPAYNQNTGSYSITLEEWNELLKVYAEETFTSVKELRNTSTTDLLNQITPVFKSPDKGVTLEFNLTGKKNLIETCKNIIAQWNETAGPQSSNFIINLITYDTKNSNGNSGNNPFEYYFKEEYLTLLSVKVNKLESLCARLDETRVDTLKLQGVDCNLFKKYLQPTYYEYTGFSDLATFQEAIKNMAPLFATLYSAISKIIPMGTNLDSVLPIIKEAYTKVLSKLDQIRTLLSSSNTEKNTESLAAILVVRLYPAQATIHLGLAEQNCIPLSNKMFVLTSSDEKNIIVEFNNNIAFNTLDTQWLSLYTTLFKYLANYQDLSCTLRAGHHRLSDCYWFGFTPSPENFTYEGFFNLKLISKNIGTALEQN